MCAKSKLDYFLAKLSSSSGGHVDKHPGVHTKLGLPFNKDEEPSMVNKAF